MEERNMKKIYNSPITTIVELKMQTSLMEASLGGVKNENATSAGMSREGGRGGSSWDDEE